MDAHGTYEEQYRSILHLLKSTTEGLLINQVSNVWNIYGGLNRLHHIMEKIFKHGCRVFTQEGDPDCWIFIQGLNWLKPTLAVSTTELAEVEDSAHLLPPNINEKSLLWIYKSLENHTLSQKLSWLLSDREHLLSCFEDTAYLCQEQYSEATLICLRAVEQNRPSLITEINPCLYLTAWTFKTFQKTHRRCSSFPEDQYHSWNVASSKHLNLKKQPSEDGSLRNKAEVKMTECNIKCSDNKKIHRQTYSCQESLECNINKEKNSKRESVECLKVNNNDFLHTNVSKNFKRWNSLPNLLNLDKQNLIMNTKSLSTFNSVFSYKSGSRTLESSLIKFETLLTSKEASAQKEENIIQKATDSGYSALSPCSKLSPSVLQVDYSSELCVEGEQEHSLQYNNHWVQKNTISPSNTVNNKKQIKVQSNNYKRIKSTSCKPGLKVASSSSSSDTLNMDTSWNNDDKLKGKFSSAITPSSRPSDLKITMQWSQSDTQQNVTTPTSTGGKCVTKRKTGIFGSAPECPTVEWLGDNYLIHRTAYKKSFIEDGGSSVLPMATGFFPQPLQGQSIMSFLSSGQFAKASAELDRENAHFSISEAMIAAIEQVKCNRHLQIAEERGDVGEDSDEEINHLKQRIRIRRRQCQEEKQRHLWGASLLSDGKTDTTTTDQSVSPLSTSPGSPSESISTDDVDDLEVDEVKNLTELKNAGLSVSMASLYSEADLSKHPPPKTGLDLALTESIVSAEGVALSLIRQFSEKQLPRASDLEWLVSEREAPQQLLPLPTSWPVSPDDAEEADMRLSTPLRGTMEWAPPRPQVIFTLHPPPVRRNLMVKQNYRCAGCGMKVAVEYAHRYRYCEYLGKYFCTGCHTNQLAVIPGKILTKWDFTRFAVSNFSYRLLDQMMTDPLFNIGDLNPNLYRKARQLEKSRLLRLQLHFLKDFILLCRFAESLKEVLQNEPVHILTRPDTYSIHDLVQVKNGTMVTRLQEIVSSCAQHVDSCELCQARGFVCELCKKSQEVIFPWQLGKVSRCITCGTCFHTACWTPSPCRRCTRLSARHGSSEITNQ